MVWYGIEFQAALLGLRYLYLHIMTNYDYFFYSLNTNESYSYVREYCGSIQLAPL